MQCNFYNQSEVSKRNNIVCFFFLINKAPGSPLFCQDYNGAYGLAGIHFGDKGQKISKAIFLGFNSFKKH